MPYYNYEYEADIGQGMVDAVFGVYLAIIFIALAFSLVAYVLQSVALHTIANRRGIKDGWLAWLPFGNSWILGSVSDQYRYLTKGEIRNRRKLLLGLSIATIVAYFAWVIVMVMAGVILGSGESMAFAMLTIMGALLITGVAVAYTVFYYMSLYDLYISCATDNGVVYFVLSIVISWLTPILVFICRNKDQGMPPRRQPVPQPAYAAPGVPVQMPVMETPIQAPVDQASAPESGFGPPGNL